MYRIKLPIAILILFGAVKINAQEINVDGKFDEITWQKAIEYSGFKTYKPDIGLDESERTKVLATSDSLNIYFAIICHDSDPKKIMANLSNRDNINNDDCFTIEMDMNGSANSNLFFRVNPLGVQEDGVIFYDEEEDLNPDKIWYSKGIITKEGYQVEIAIPFKSIRFKWEPNVEINMGFKRKIYRKSEIVVYPEYSEEVSNRLMQRETLVFSNIQKQKVLEIIPSLTYTYDQKLENAEWKMKQNRLQAGITGKIGLTSDLMLDVTYNPDFSQIEGDEGQVDINLRNPLRFPEKRPFFQEGVELFQFGTQSWWDMPFTHLVHTRNIVDPIYGLKLIGKLGDKYSVASIISADEHYNDYDHYQILRLRRNFKDDNYLGVVCTGKEFSNGFNRIGGLDGVIRLSGKSSMEYYCLISFKDDTLNFKSGNSFGVVYKYKDKIHFLRIGYSQIDKDFETQIGFLERSGLQIIPVSYSAIFPVDLNWLNNAGLIFHTRQKRDMYSNKHEHSTNVGLQLNFNNDSWLQVGRRFSTEVFQNKTFGTGAFQSYYFVQFNKYISSEGYIRWGNQIYYDPNSPYQGYGWMTDHTLKITPTNQLKINLSGCYADFYRSSDNKFIYDYKLIRLGSTYQMSKYLFVRVVGEYNFYKENLNSELLISFNYIPGTVLQFGYNLNAEKNLLDKNLVPDSDLQLNQNLFFLKASYLFKR